MSTMEDDASNFLKKIVKTLSAALIWLLMIAITGIYFGWMFFSETPSTGNFIFYAWMILTLGALLRYLFITWKDHLK
ncbi:MAG: hypothetical protein ABI687_11390 [Flavitalea sp.]